MEISPLLIPISAIVGVFTMIILMRKFEELSFAEIGRRMGRSEDACRMLLARALTALTLRLAGEPR